MSKKLIKIHDLNNIKTVRDPRGNYCGDSHMKRKFQSGNNCLVLYDCGTALLRYGDSSPIKGDYYESGDLITIRLEGDTMQMIVEEGGISSPIGDKWEEVYPFDIPA